MGACTSKCLKHFPHNGSVAPLKNPSVALLRLSYLKENYNTKKQKTEHSQATVATLPSSFKESKINLLKAWLPF